MLQTYVIRDFKCLSAPYLVRDAADVPGVIEGVTPAPAPAPTSSAGVVVLTVAGLYIVHGHEHGPAVKVHIFAGAHCGHPADRWSVNGRRTARSASQRLHSTNMSYSPCRVI